MGIRRTVAGSKTFKRFGARYGGTIRGRFYSLWKRIGRGAYKIWRGGPSLFERSRNSHSTNIYYGRRISLEALQKTFDAIPPELNIQEKSVALACGVVRAVLGKEWFHRYAMPEGKKNIFTINDSGAIEREKSMIKIIDLAEVLYNLQRVHGYDECVSRLRQGNIEGSFAELDFGRMLFLNRVPFRYVVPQQVKKLDYDVEILYPNNLVACADAKCKIEATEFTDNGIKNVLNDARGQLPNDAPGVVFVKVPPRWIEKPEINLALVQRARRFLGGVSRIVSVKYYASPLTFRDNMMIQQHAYKEISNPKTDFGNNINWDIFKPHDMSEFPSGMPPHWQRILFFPDGIRR